MLMFVTIEFFYGNIINDLYVIVLSSLGLRTCSILTSFLWNLYVYSNRKEP